MFAPEVRSETAESLAARAGRRRRKRLHHFQLGSSTRLRKVSLDVRAVASPEARTREMSLNARQDTSLTSAMPRRGPACAPMVWRRASRCSDGDTRRWTGPDGRDCIRRGRREDVAAATSVRSDRMAMLSRCNRRGVDARADARPADHGSLGWDERQEVDHGTGRRRRIVARAGEARPPPFVQVKTRVASESY